jgi:hypothetical protein
MTAAIDLDAQAQALYLRYVAAAKATTSATLRHAYGDGTRAAMVRNSQRRDAVMQELLDLRGITADEWTRMTLSERQAAWGR